MNANLQLNLFATYSPKERKILVTVTLSNFVFADFFVGASSILLDGSAGCSLVTLEVSGASEVRCNVPCYAWSASIDPTQLKSGKSISNTFDLSTFCDLTDIESGTHTIQFSTKVTPCNNFAYTDCIGEIALTASATVEVV